MKERKEYFDKRDIYHLKKFGKRINTKDKYLHLYEVRHGIYTFWYNGNWHFVYHSKKNGMSVLDSVNILISIIDHNDVKDLVYYNNGGDIYTTNYNEDILLNLLMDRI